MWSILCFGDSITWGAGERPAIGWTGRLKQKIESSADHRTVYNLGISGDTSSDLLKRFKTECDARVRIKRPQDRFLILIAIGINDSLWYAGTKSKRFRVTTKQFEERVLKLITIAKQYRAKTALIGLTPVDETRTVPYEETIFRNERVAMFNEILKKCSTRAGVQFLDLFSSMSTADYRSMLDDGLHPNEKGYDFMYAQIVRFIKHNNLFPGLRNSNP